MTQSKIIHETKFLQLKEAPSPSNHPWYYAHRNNISGVVVIVPIIKDTYTVFIETRRPPIYAEGIAETCIEFPAGLVGDIEKEESLLDAARKELLEETGYSAQSVELVAQKSCSSPGCTSEIFSIAIAQVSDETPTPENMTSDGGVIIARHKVLLTDARNWLAEQERLGKSVSAQTYAGMWFISH